jgi:hypothetical protein
MPGPGYFQWNTGVWFGGQLGGTAWMLVGAAVLTPRAPEVAAVWLFCFAVANAIGSWLWWRRDRLRPYPAMQLLLLACGASGLLALISLHVLRPGLRIDRPKRFQLKDEPRYIVYLTILIIIMIVWLYFLDRAAREGRRSQGRPSD